MRIYVDTSVVGGCLDDEFRDGSVQLFDRFRRGDAVAVLSDITLAELAGAPPSVQAIVEGLPDSSVECVRQSKEAEKLAEAYILRKAVPRRMELDAQHIAIATVARVDVLVSWNFKHIVNLDRIRAFNAVNSELGYNQLEIRAPLEIWKDED